MPHPPKLAAIVAHFTSLSEDERRENLIACAEQSSRHEPRPGETFEFEDVRRDEECADTVAIFLRLDGRRRVALRIRLGPHVQTLTRAMAVILCKGLAGLTPEEVIGLPRDFIPAIVGSRLVRLRSQTVFYLLARIKTACRVLLERRRAAESVG